MQGFEEKLVQSVFLRPCLYDKLNKQKKDRKVTAKAWREIAGECEKSVDQVKKRWRGLRDTFFREMKKLKSPSGAGCDPEFSLDVSSTWPWFNQLLFLKEVNLPLITEDNLSDPISADEIEQHEDGTDTLEETTGALIAEYPVAETSQSTSSVTAYVPIGKKRSKDTVEDRLIKAIDKLGDVVAQPESNEQSSPSPNALFGQFVVAEMDKMSAEEQDEVQFAFFDALSNVKRARKK
ncbi:unnamed protein product [Allacma fusca]|uniref:MADF domain-containing protein n=1 Tax=Allacma fusca TaxID=39272 RepID=A0A8J2JV00_9HEXA|nr:unnamed protein product [Allacma fusca]